MQDRLLFKFILFVGGSLVLAYGLFWTFSLPEVIESVIYLPLHTAMEAFSIVVSWMIFGIAWNNCDLDRPRNIYVLGVGFLAVGLLDFAHLLSYQGMPEWVTPSGPRKAIVFWLAARLISVMAMAVALGAPWKQSLFGIDRWLWLTVFMAMTAAAYWGELFHSQWMPRFWVEGHGLTRGKQALEFVIVVSYLLIALASYHQFRRSEHSTISRSLFLSAGLMAVSEWCFTVHASVTDVFDLLGHLYKVMAYWFLYHALFLQLVREPFQKLALSRHEIWLEKERAEVTLQSIMDGVITTDAEGRILTMNPVAWQLTGYSLEAARGRPVSEIIQLADETEQCAIINPVERCLREQRAIALSNHAMLTSAFGQRYAIEQLASPVIDREGRIIGVVMVFRDVGERRRIQDQIQAQKQSLIEAQAIAHLGNWSWHIASDRIECSAEFFRIFGCEPNSREFDYPTFLSTLHPEDAARVRKAVDNALSGSEPYDIEYRVVHGNGALRHVQARGKVQRDAEGRPAMMFGTVLDITERKLAEEILLRSKQEIEDLYNNVPCGYHSLDADGIFLRVNQTELDWLGYRRDELVGKMHIAQLVSADTANLFFKHYPQLKRAGVVKDLEIELLRKDGSIIDVILNATAIYDDEGHFVASRSTITDISKQRQAQRVLAKHAAELRHAQTIAHVGSWQWNIAGDTQTWSEETYRIFGLAAETQHSGSQGLAEQVVSPGYQRFIDLVVPEDRQMIVECVNTALKSSAPYFAEFRIQRPDGEVHHIVSRAEVLRSATGEPLAMMGTNLDITERKQTELALRLSEAEQRRQIEMQTAIIDALPVNLALLDSDGLIVAVNQRWRDFAGDNGRPGQASDVGTNYLAVCQSLTGDGSDALSALNGLRGVLNGDDERFIMEYPCHSPKQQCWFRMLVAPLSFRERLGAVVIHLDITESRQHQIEIEVLNQQLEQRVAERTSQLQAANKELEAFSYSVSHDLRAPLHIISGFAQLLLDDPGIELPENARQQLQRIMNGALRMGELINNLLQLSRVGRGELHIGPVDLSRMANDILAELRRETPERQARFNVMPGLTVDGDSHLLRIALENLLGNAWKFSRRQTLTEIAFGGRQENRGMIYYVRDNGAGFNKKYAYKLFNAFQRLHSEDEFEGTGIGLATVKRIVLCHGGKIWADSEPGAGTTFFFQLHCANNHKNGETQCE
ncbi:MASE3 domain-containing protein [Methylomonas rivi]|uniref:histidine kinase n=1 Tax=Methylomonas rivi TaxID=2952226 RepID=A0ABT1U6X0_9GAMM|nr:MASE3 domain-containing protein [Methylomonas sp. WSC-6]MCQ8129125.1 PAS domain S-box protein [Methylomonas sp. WSC-6]